MELYQLVFTNDVNALFMTLPTAGEIQLTNEDCLLSHLSLNESLAIVEDVITHVDVEEFLDKVQVLHNVTNWELFHPS